MELLIFALLLHGRAVGNTDGLLICVKIFIKTLDDVDVGLV